MTPSPFRVRSRAPHRQGLRALLLLLAALLPALALETAAGEDLDKLPTVRAMETARLALPSDGIRGIRVEAERVVVLATDNRGLSAPETSFEARLLTIDSETGAVDTLATERDGYESGLVHDGEAYWSSGSLLGGHAGLYRISPGDGQVVSTLPSPGYHPAGLAWDGTYLWQVDADARKLMRIDVEEGKVSRKVASPAFYPTGLAYDGFNFWCADASTGRIYRMKGFNGRTDGVIASEAFFRPGEFVSLSWDGEGLWAVCAGDLEAVRLEILR